VHETIQVAGGLLDLLAEIIVGIQVENVGHEVKRILVVRDLGVEAREVEAIGQIIFIDLTKVLISTR
jgi:hypothetical protein